MNLAKRKSFQAGLAVLIAVVIVLAGAFAWYSFSQQALNIFEGTTIPGGNVIDDYEDGKQNKDVFVQNSGEQPLYVRIKFDEYMEINDKALGSWTQTDLSTWHVHDYMGTTPENCTDDCDIHTYYKWVLGNKNTTKDPNGGWKYYLPAPYVKQALFDVNGKQIKQPEAVSYYENTTAQENRVLAKLYGYSASGTVDGSTWGTDGYMQTAPEMYARIDTILGADFDDTYDQAWADANLGATNLQYLASLYEKLDTALLGTNTTAIETAKQNLYDFLYEYEIGYWDQVLDVTDDKDFFATLPNGIDYNETDTTKLSASERIAFAAGVTKGAVEFVPIQRTLTTEKVITMAQWIKDGMLSGDFWVVDEDGWCYWASVLQPGEATGLLLSEVVLSEKPTGNWWYGINVNLEAATYSDIKEFYGNEFGNEKITVNGIALLDMISGNYVFDLEPNLDPTKLPTVHTFFNNGDNTYRVKDSENGPYDKLFIFTGDPTLSDGSLRAAAANSSYDVNDKFRKTLSDGVTTYEFTVVDAGHKIPDKGYDITDNPYGSGIIEVNGKRYVMLGYGDYIDPTTNDFGEEGETSYGYDASGWEKIAWLAVGPDGVFGDLTGAPLASNNDDVLIWTSGGNRPGMGHDRYVEDESKPEARIGQLLPYQIDGKDWLVLGFKEDTGRKVLLISNEVLVTGIIDNNTDIADEIAKYTTAGSSPEKLEGMLGIDNAAKIGLLTVNEAIDYFADGRARVANDTNGAASAWWIVDGVISTIGNIDSMNSIPKTGDGPLGAGIRVAVWLDSDELSDYLVGESEK